MQPRMSSKLTISRLHQGLAFAGLSTILLVSAGCGSHDEDSKAIGEARNTMLATASGGSAAPPREVRSKGYAQSITLIEPATDSDDATKALAAAITAASTGAQGDVAAEEYREADAELLMALNEANASLSLYTKQRTLAQALAMYNPAKDLESFDQQLAARRAELETAQRDKTANDAKVKEILDRAKAKMDEGRTLRAAEASFQDRLLDAPATERPSLAQQLYDARRASHAVMKEAEFLEAEAARVAPLSPEFALTVKRIETQIASLEQAKQGAQDAAKTHAEQAAISNRAAEQTAAEVAEKVANVQTILSERVKPAYESSLSKLSSASGKWGQARGGASNQLVQISTASAVLSTASLQREYSECLGRVTQLLQMAAATNPPIDRASEFREAGVALEAEAMQAREAARESYERAKTTLGSVGGGPVAERAQRLAEHAEAMWIKLGGTPPAPPEPAPEEVPATEEAPAEAPVTGMELAPDAAPEAESTNPDESAAPESESPGSEEPAPE